MLLTTELSSSRNRWLCVSFYTTTIHHQISEGKNKSAGFYPRQLQYITKPVS
jgi:hypothetical protein